jgi:hypothetical protein
MSGHVSELTPAGIKFGTLNRIVNICAEKGVEVMFDDVFAFFRMLYTSKGVDDAVLSSTLTNQYEAGACATRTAAFGVPAKSCTPRCRCYQKV